MSSNSIPSHLQDLLSRLEFLAMIEKGKKPCMTDLTFVDASSWWGSLKRTFYRESRQNTIIHIQQTVELGIVAIAEYGKSDFIRIIINTINRVEKGLENLILTYNDYPEIVSQLRIIIANIKLQIEKNRSFLDHEEIVKEPVKTVTRTVVKSVAPPSTTASLTASTLASTPAPDKV